MTTAPAAAHLATVIRRWDDLTDALTARQTSEWPPAMGITSLLDREDAGEALAERAERREYGDRLVTLGASPAPISISVLDVMRQVEADLVYCADVIAAEIQRPPMSLAPRGAGWTEAEIARRDQLAAEDAADPRRWRYRGHRRAPYAAGWLAARLEGVPGPFLRLGSLRADRIATVAAQAAEQVERALQLARRAATVRWPCPHCRGQLHVEGGDGQPPAVRCQERGCGWTRTAQAPAA